MFFCLFSFIRIWKVLALRQSITSLSEIFLIDADRSWKYNRASSPKQSPGCSLRIFYFFIETSASPSTMRKKQVALSPSVKTFSPGLVSAKAKLVEIRASSSRLKSQNKLCWLRAFSASFISFGSVIFCSMIFMFSKIRSGVRADFFRQSIECFLSLLPFFYFKSIRTPVRACAHPILYSIF